MMHHERCSTPSCTASRMRVVARVLSALTSVSGPAITCSAGCEVVSTSVSVTVRLGPPRYIRQPKQARLNSSGMALVS